MNSDWKNESDKLKHQIEAIWKVVEKTQLFTNIDHSWIMRVNTFHHTTDEFDSADNYEDIYEEIRLDPYTQLPVARVNNNTLQPEIHKNVMTMQNTIPQQTLPQVSSYSRF